MLKSRYKIDSVQNFFNWFIINILIIKIKLKMCMWLQEKWVFKQWSDLFTVSGKKKTPNISNEKEQNRQHMEPGGGGIKSIRVINNHLFIWKGTHGTQHLRIAVHSEIREDWRKTLRFQDRFRETHRPRNRVIWYLTAFPCVWDTRICRRNKRNKKKKRK